MECQKCGACCEILYPMIFGHKCYQYDKVKHLCKIYDKRPEMCRDKHILRDDIKESLCERLRQVRDKNNE